MAGAMMLARAAAPDLSEKVDNLSYLTKMAESPAPEEMDEAKRAMKLSAAKARTQKMSLSVIGTTQRGRTSTRKLSQKASKRSSVRRSVQSPLSIQ